MSKRKNQKSFFARNRYAICCVFSALASLLGFVNPVLSSFIVSTVVHDLNLFGIIPSLVAMAAVNGARMFLRSTVTNNLKGNVRAPLIWLQRRIGKRLWWLEPMVGSWGWIGLIVTRITGGVSAQASMFFATMLTDTVNSLASGIVYYFTENYFLSLLTALILPTLFIAPWFAGNLLHLNRLWQPHQH